MALNLDDLIGSMQNGFSAGDRGSELVAMREELRRTLGEHALGPSSGTRAARAGDGSGGSMEMDFAESSNGSGRQHVANGPNGSAMDDDVMGMEGVDTLNAGGPYDQPLQHSQTGSMLNGGGAGVGTGYASSGAYMYGYGVPGRVGGSYPAYEHGTAGISSASSPGMRIPSSGPSHRPFAFGHGQASSNGSYRAANGQASASTNRHYANKLAASPASATTTMTTNHSPHSIAAFSPFPTASLGSSLATSTSTSTNHHDYGFSPGSDRTSGSAMSIASPGPAHAPANTPQQTPVENRGDHMRHASFTTQQHGGQEIDAEAHRQGAGAGAGAEAVAAPSGDAQPRASAQPDRQRTAPHHHQTRAQTALDESALHAKLIASAAAAAAAAATTTHASPPTSPRSPGFQARRSVVGFQPSPSFPA